MSAADLSNALADRYRVERELGTGGMATVYLAHDVRHDRPVALKVLKPELAAVIGAERFLAEIKTTANLQHPHILPLFDSGQVDGTVFYAMPFIDGESLRDRLKREKQLPVDTALRIATEVADALQYAHGHGVIHRDIKPENILLHGGHAQVADFGIALAASNTAGSRITETGMSLGTPTYMSPEQAIGDRTIDGRSDVYSLGATTYEMLAGDPPYVAGTAQAIIAKVLTERAPSVRVARPSVSANVDSAIARALEKLPADRFATALEFSEALNLRASTTASTAAGTTARAAAATRRRPWPYVAAALAIIAVSTAWIAGRESKTASGASDAPVVRAILDVQTGDRVYDVLSGSTVALSPKGDIMAYTTIGTSGFRTFIRRTSELAQRSLTDGNNVTVAGRNLAFSPDGRWLALTEGNELKKASVDGGQVINVKALTTAVPYGLAWLGNDTIVVGSFSGMEEVSLSGGTSTMIGLKDSASVRVGQRWPVAIPGGRYVAFALANAAADPPRLAILDTRTRTFVTHDVPASVPLGFLDGQFVYVATSGAIMAVPFDVQSRKPVGESIPLEDGVVFDPTGGAKAALSASGTLLYLKGRAEYQPVFVSPASGVPTPLLSELHLYANPRFSPDGNRVAITVANPRSSDIFIYDIPRNTFTQLTTDGVNLRPEWTPDGKRVLFRSERSGKVGIWWQPADASGPAEVLYEPPYEPFEAIISPDSKWLIYRTAPGSVYSRDILAVPLQGERKLLPLVVSPATEQQPRLSPDGKWLSYQSNETSRFEIYVRPFPENGARVRVSSEGGTEPIWNRAGTALYYRDGLGQIVEVKVTTTAGFSIGAHRIVVSGDYLTDASHASYDVAPDGRFLLLKRAGAEAQTIVVHNWGRELREKTARRK
ncbi:MAG TPA: protein kinase [Gemmatimonadaceae bacterium]